MFERRLKIFLLIVFGISVVLCLRALQIQLVHRHALDLKAEQFNKKSEYIETVRGRILDRKGREIAVDTPCIDAAVAYPAILQTPDPKWLDAQAGKRLSKRLGDEYTKAARAKREAMRKDEIPKVREDLARMWATLAECEGLGEQKLDEARQQIVRKVEMRRRWIWYKNYQTALDKHAKRKPDPWYTSWLIDDDRPPTQDEFQVQVADELASHPVLKAVRPETVTLLGKDPDRYPGLSLQPSTHREYPFEEAGCHWIGSLSPVTKAEREAFPNYRDELRGYDYNDLVGRGGVEALAEPTLRGTRGLIERTVNSGAIKSETPAVPGKDVTVTADIELQRAVQKTFENVTIHYKQEGAPVTETLPYLHGAAVVIDVASGEVLALASNPGFNLNKLDQLYPELAMNSLDKPLFNRATLATREPGSTVKPIVGLWGIHCGVMGVHDTIECTGYMISNGRPVRWNRCWVASRYAGNPLVPSVAHHPVPVPHKDGFLDLADAEERSCNIYFQVIAERLGFERLAEGMAAFGLGRPTGIGIAERAGRLPKREADMRNWLGALWSAGIGQGKVAATPIQMANVAATIARGGTWMRPSLVMNESRLQLNRAVPTSRPAAEDIGIPPEAIAQARKGMWNVVHGSAGTGKNLDFPTASGKTGTAQAAAVWIPVLDAKKKPVPRLGPDGQPMKDDDGELLYEKTPLTPSTKDQPNALAPWYLGSGISGTDLSHAWFIGFAPKENPKVAFAVLIEYGGSGGLTAAAVAKRVLDACVEQGYLPKE